MAKEEKRHKKLTKDESRRMGRFMLKEALHNSDRPEGEKRSREQQYAIGLSKLDSGEI